MDIEKLVVDGMFWLGISGVALSIVAGFKKYVIDATAYDNTGLLDNYKHKNKYCKE